MSYCGKIARINLTGKKTEFEAPEENFYRTYFGGRALIGYYLCKEVPVEVDPFDPENLLIFSAGVLTGMPFAGSGRHSVGALSPLTGGFGSSEAGGFFGAELKKAGFDALIISGEAERPSYLMIEDGRVEIVEAPELWGKTTRETDRLLRERYGQKVRIAQCGPAGEKKVRFACVVHDLRHFAGRTGMGAVMGAKKLRAVVVRGSSKVEPANRSALVAYNRSMREQIISRSGFLGPYGTAGIVDGLNTQGGLPTMNFKEGVFADYEKINGEALKDQYLVGRETCYACPVRCKRVVEVSGTYEVGSDSGGPEYETIAALGSACGISDLAAICRANELCTDYGMDSISTGMAIAFAMECAEKGFLEPGDYGGFLPRFGDSESMLQLLTAIGDRSGLGNILGEGTAHAVKILGENTRPFAMQVKGQELPLHEPRLKYALGLGYAVSPTGADHMHNMHDTAVANSTGSMAEFGFLEPLSPQSLDCRKVAIYRFYSTWRHFFDCAVLCMFISWTPSEAARLTRSATGWNSTTVELLRVGERAVNLARVFNDRHGIGRDIEKLPSRFSEPFKDGPLVGKAISYELMESAKKNYYSLMGWDEQGVPSQEKLSELNLDWLNESN